jgi:hypothetical protein
VPKQGPVFARVMNHLIELGIREEACNYSTLSTAVIQHQLSAFGYKLGGSGAPGRASFGSS